MKADWHIHFAISLFSPHMLRSSWRRFPSILSARLERLGSGAVVVSRWKRSRVPVLLTPVRAAADRLGSVPGFEEFSCLGWSTVRRAHFSALNTSPFASVTVSTPLRLTEMRFYFTGGEKTERAIMTISVPSCLDLCSHNSVPFPVREDDCNFSHSGSLFCSYFRERFLKAECRLVFLDR